MVQAQEKITLIQVYTGLYQKSSNWETAIFK